EEGGTPGAPAAGRRVDPSAGDDRGGRGPESSAALPSPVGIPAEASHTDAPPPRTAGAELDAEHSETSPTPAAERPVARGRGTPVEETRETVSDPDEAPMPEPSDLGDYDSGPRYPETDPPAPPPPAPTWGRRGRRGR